MKAAPAPLRRSERKRQPVTGRLLLTFPRLPLPPLPVHRACTELRTSCVTGSTWRDLRTAWISQILSLFADHNPRVGGSSPSSGIDEVPQID